MRFMGPKAGMDKTYTTIRMGTSLQRWSVVIATAVLCASALAAQPSSPAPAPVRATAASPQAGARPLDSPATPMPGISPATLTRDTSFGEAIDVLRNATQPPLNIIVLWRQIGDNADIFRETPIGFDSIPGLRLRQYLDTLLLSVSAGGIAKLGYVVDGGAIIIATTDALPVPKSVPRVYDVSDLVGAPSYAPSPGMMRMMYGGGMMGGGLMGGGMMGGYGQGLGQGFGGYGGYTSGTGLQGLVGPVTGARR